MMLLSKVPQWWFAAGNDNIDVNRVTPGGCEQVISVAANDSSANRAVFPNYVDKVDVIAPEVNIISINNAGGYRALSSASMAASHVAGVIALMSGQNNNLLPVFLEQLLKDNTPAFITNSNCHKDHVNYNNKACGTGKSQYGKNIG